MLRVGIVCFNGVSQRIINAITENVSTTLVAICVEEEIEIRNITEQHNIVWYNDEITNTLIIDSSHNMIHQILTDCIETRKHIVLYQTRYSTSCSEQVLELMKGRNMKLITSNNVRNIPAYKKAKQLLDEGVIGDLIYAQADIANYWDKSNSDMQFTSVDWESLTAVRGRFVDLLTWIIGDDVNEVKASLSDSPTKRDCGCATFIFLSYKNGKNALVLSSGLYSSEPTFDITIVGTKGFIKADMFKGTWMGKDEELRLVKKPEKRDPTEIALCLEWKELCDSIIEGKTLSCPTHRLQVLIKVIDSVHRSSMLETEVSII